METTHRIALLFSRYVQRTITPAEFEELLTWLADYDEQEAHALSAPLQELWQQAKAGLLPSTADKVDWNSVLQQVVNSDKKAIALYPAIGGKWTKFRIAAAAIILLLLSAAGFFLLRHPDLPAVATKAPRQLPENILPGGNKALLTLADGSVVVLDSLPNGWTARQGDTKIVKINGQLQYTAATANSPAGLTGYNKLVTPRGGQYQLVLPDGSKVWLNAASSIRYPMAFAGTERQVDITGEAYFEVAPLYLNRTSKKIPFIVNVNGMKVQVLGTHFNIMAYDDEASIITTLLEGAVKVTQGASGLLLTPGNQAQLSRVNGRLSVSEANTDMAVAWKDGLFYFDKDNVKTIMRQVARWYNLTIAYEGKVPEDLFSGKIERRLPLSGILHLLEQGKIHYRIEMNTLTIRP